MTISTTTSVVTYQGNNATTAWTFSFVGDNSSTISVYLTNSSGIIGSALPSNQYGIVINSVPVGGLWGIGGTVTYPLSGSPLAPGNYISIVRNVPYTQNVSISNQGAFYPQAVEQALDILELQIQQINTESLYSVRAPIQDPLPLNTLPTYNLRANGYLSFDATGQPIISSIPSTTPLPGAFAIARKIATTGTSTINILPSDSFGGVSIYQSSTPVTTLQLPTGLFGPFPIIDGSGNAGSFPLTVLPPAGMTINGSSQYIMAFNYQSITLACDTSGEYFVI